MTTRVILWTSALGYRSTSCSLRTISPFSRSFSSASLKSTSLALPLRKFINPSASWQNSRNEIRISSYSCTLSTATRPFWVMIALSSWSLRPRISEEALARNSERGIRYVVYVAKGARPTFVGLEAGNSIKPTLLTLDKSELIIKKLKWSNLILTHSTYCCYPSGRPSGSGPEIAKKT